MITDMLTSFSEMFSSLGSTRNVTLRQNRTSRRFSICQGIEGLEGRLAPGTAAIGITLTNQNSNPPTVQANPTPSDFNVSYSVQQMTA